MVFWLFLALLTIAASLAVLLPLARRPQTHVPASAHDLEVYRDQLAEIERDRQRGLIGESEAEEARAEIGRRMIKLEAAGTEGSARASRFLPIVAAGAVLGVPLLSWGVYATIGSPDLPAQPLAQRLEKDPRDNTLDELVARAEGHIRANPEDGRGWNVLAPIYLRLNRPEDAVIAYRNAIRLLGSDAARETGLGEALFAEAGGIVTKESAEAFRRALEAGGNDNPKARFYLATAQAQEGRLEEAVAGLTALMGDLPQASPWRGVVGQALARAQAELGAPVAGGPSSDDVAAAAQMNAEDRAAMIETMVASLDERLRDNPADADGWRRLVRSYSVLGRKDDARQALERGLKALGADSEAGQELRDFAGTLGLGAVE
ncbi:c-type cytochrome biogenesis protein CcmI [Nitratireductor sp. StC3]|uniref:c-type cytochrome biogenesis protein CcmI n=1 Tax=Nitratireductor sp. StC3 TaxID=2126741 RepID=UPI000D0CFD09|nr:c-type cytochrome biogenesis protein CcmI [Nitratireductor sp. StC3]PSM18135.1 c-type cytochrome biogenesis protein CcmI [Nitratireductor sp. StC3]